MPEVFNATDGRNQFLEMFVAQVKNQDPLSPADQTQILGQLAQFSQVESLETLNKNFDTLLQNQINEQSSSLTSTASSLLGRHVEVDGANSGIVESVRQSDGQVLVEVDGHYVPLSDVNTISLNGGDS